MCQIVLSLCGHKYVGTCICVRNNVLYMYCLMYAYACAYSFDCVPTGVMQNEKLERALNAFRSDHDELEREMVESKELAKKEQKEKEHIKKVWGLNLLRMYQSTCMSVCTSSLHSISSPNHSVVDCFYLHTYVCTYVNVCVLPRLH